MRAGLTVTLYVLALAAGVTWAGARALQRDPDLPLPLRLPNRRLLVAKQPLTLGLTAKALSTPVTASSFQIPLGDGSYSSWGAQGFDFGDPTGLDYAMSWGFNTAGGGQLDPTRNMLALSIESNYLPPGDTVHYAEAYLSFVAPDGTVLRPWHVGIPLTGPQAYKPFMLVMTDWFSILDSTQTVQKLKVSNFVALAHDIPLVFSGTDGCAGCAVDVGLQPSASGQLEIFQGLPSNGVPGDLLVGTVTATALAGDGSAVTNLDAAAIASGTLADGRLSTNVALADRSSTFSAPQYFYGGSALGTPGVVVEGAGTNIFPNIALTNAGAPVAHSWAIVDRGDTGALVITDGTPGDNGRLAIDTQGTVTVSGNVAVQGKVNVAEGLDKTVGQAALVNGVVTVTTKAVAANSRIFLSYAGITGQPGTLYSDNIQAGTSFEIHSTSATDNSPVNYWIIN